MAARVFACFLLMTVLFIEKTMSMGGRDDGEALSEPKNCTMFFCRFVLVPCQSYSVLASYETGSIDITFSANLSRCTGELITGQAVPWRVHTSSNYSDRNAPLLVTARQLSNGYTTSWNLPDQSETFETGSAAISQTLCPSLSDNGSSLSEVVVDILSRSSVNFSVQISIEPVWNFQLSLDEPLNFTLSGVQSSQVYYFPFPNDSSSLFSLSASDSSSSGGSQTCLITSIQETMCPYESTLEQIRFEGEHQTMGNQSTFVVEAAKYSSDGSGGLFIIFIPTTYDNCVPGDVNTTAEADDYTKNITLTVTLLKPSKFTSHTISWLLPWILAVIVLGLSFISLTPFICDCSWKCMECTWRCIEKCWCCRCCKRELKEVMVVKVSLTSVLSKNMKDVRVVHMTQQEGLSRKYWIYFWYSVIVAVFYALPAFQALLYKLELLNTNGDQDLCYYNFKCAYPAFKGKVHAINNVYSNLVFLLLGLLFILFVSIRSWMVVRWKKKYASDEVVIRRLGKIAERLEQLGREPREHPQPCNDEELEDIELECKERLALLEEEKLLKSKGVPEFNGLYYAIGFAMAMEGVMSGIYHICPTDTNFQFDTAFMFVMGGLVLVKVMQSRFPDLHTHSSITFLVFSLVLLLTFIGIKISSGVLAGFVFFVIMLIIPLAIVSLYFYHPLLWKEFSLCGCLKSTIKQLRDSRNKSKEPAKARDDSDLENNKSEEDGKANAKTVDKNSKSTASAVCSRGRCIRIGFAAGGALALNVCVFVYVTLDHEAIGMGFVVFLLANLVALSTIYIVNKIYYCEHWTWIPLMWGVIGVLSWGSALYFFLWKRVYITEDTPAQSQESNSECLPETFYDYHDLWHILAAIALYSTASAILFMDDGLVKTAINKIPAF